MYNKPVILTNDDMAEGVYAASGDNGQQVTVTHIDSGNIYDKWEKFHVKLSGEYGVQVKLTFNFDKPGVAIDSGSGNTLTIYNPGPGYECDIVARGELGVQCLGATMVTEKWTW